MIVLKGLLRNVLGNYSCIRGYARLGDLAKISETDASFQRDINEKHKQEITEYYQGIDNIFFSEIILGLNLDSNIMNFHHVSQMDTNGEKILIKNNNKKAAIRLKTNKGMNEANLYQDLRYVTLELDDSYIEQQKPFIRIDGNHRLQATQGLSDHKLDMVCPFCIIIFSTKADVNSEGDSNNVDDTDKVQQSIIFHNINSKGVSLTSEETLTGIFEVSEKNYSSDDLAKNMGWEYVLAKKIFKELSFEHLPDIEKVFESRERSTLVDIIKFLYDKGLILSTEKNMPMFKNCMTVANSIYSDSPELGKNKAIFISLFYYLYREIDKGLDVSSDVSKKKAKAFVKWLIHNHMCKAELTHPKEVVEIYDSIHSNEVKIFMAMTYYDDSIVAEYNEALDSVVKKIKDNNPQINLKNYSIMNNHSPTHNIVVDIFEKIDSCGIFIADITDNNSNVLYEYGYAKGKEKPCILLINDLKKTQPVKSDYISDLYFKFDGHTIDLKNKLEIEICSTLESMGYKLDN